MMKERATFVQDILTEGSYLFEPPSSYDANTVAKKWKDSSKALMEEWATTLNAVPSFDAASIEQAFKSFIEEKGLGIGAVLPLFRLLLTGQGMGPSMFEISAYLGKEACMTRMAEGIVAVESAKTQA